MKINKLYPYKYKDMIPTLKTKKLKEGMKIKEKANDTSIWNVFKILDDAVVMIRDSDIDSYKDDNNRSTAIIVSLDNIKKYYMSAKYNIISDSIMRDRLYNMSLSNIVLDDLTPEDYA